MSWLIGSLIHSHFLYFVLPRREKSFPPPAHGRSVSGSSRGRSSRGQSVLFSNDPRITLHHKETVRAAAALPCHALRREELCLTTVLRVHTLHQQVTYCGAGEQDLLCINERQVMVRSKAMYDTEPPNTSLEGVRSDLQKRYGIPDLQLYAPSAGLSTKLTLPLLPSSALPPQAHDRCARARCWGRCHPPLGVTGQGRLYLLCFVCGL